MDIQEVDLREMVSVIQSKVILEVSTQVQSLLDSLETTTLDIAVTGESGAGKSTFINAVLGIGDDDFRAAKTGVVETTASAISYRHPHLPRVRLWDLPGIGSPSFQAQKYLQQVRLERYDFFIIVTSERFRENHTELARAVSAMGKRFYFVRSKVDQDLRATQRRRPTLFQEAQVLQEIESDCTRQLKKEGLENPKVFLISSFHLHRFDFHRLQETLAEELAGHKRHTLLLSFPSVTAAAVQKKKNSLRRHIWKKALLACIIAALPGHPLHLNVPMLMRALQAYQQHFGLDDASLETLAATVSKPPCELKTQVRSTFARHLSADAVQAVLRQAAVCREATAMALKTQLPVFNNLVAGAVSFLAAYYLLHTALDSFAEDAQRVLERAYSLETTEAQGSFGYLSPGFLCE
ncbi:interferon-inducible GTPase 5-like [Erythrolamprus reginae]|uniref:interferon-inducible GTPase 5-like n=1 Tax=Erythrolamprus reginae TaxID=121349 RepID=UPI00396C3419